MKNAIIMAAAAFAVAMATTTANAADEEALAKAKGCLACHTKASKLIGPPYKDVAAKYKGDKEAATKLQTSVLKGSQGKYGPIPMPPNKVTDEEAKALVAWILTL